MDDQNKVHEVNAVPPPVFAPLPLPFVSHVCEQVCPDLPIVAQQVSMYRTSVYTYMDPFVLTEQTHHGTDTSVRREPTTIDTGWLLASLALNSPNRRRIPMPTFSDWYKRGLLRYRAWGFPDFHSAAALLLMRMVDRQPRGWLPSTMSAQEPQWWCWRQDAPEQPILPCPYPLPPEIPDSALLWTCWSGAAWDGDWVQMGQKGAIRWKGIRQHPRRCWAISREQLAVWDSSVTWFHRPLPLSGYGSTDAEEQFVHVLATAVLYRLAQGRLLEAAEKGKQ